MPPRKGRLDLPQPILHPIASHATFTSNTSNTEELPPPPPPPPAAPAVALPILPSSSSAAAAAAAAAAAPPPDYLSFSYLRSRKLEPYLPPPPDQHQPSAYTAFHQPPQHHHQYQQQQHQQQQQHHHHQGGGGPSQAQISPDSPPPTEEEEEEEEEEKKEEEVLEEQEEEEEGEEEEEEEEEEEIDWKPRPFVTLTYAQSLDSMLATTPGARTAISGPSTKAMTHFLRSRHDAVLVGVGTAVADDPGLDCRLEVEMGGGHQPRPVVLDPFARWDVARGSKAVRLAREGKGLGPWVLHMDRLEPDAERVRVLEEVGGGAGGAV
ncbi:2,5-diamino-6-ribosylamino-4(3H)-pyrimidinone 5'-phosphate reductase [Cytospora mali]|uniref:2,5-diamino-6-ribosylamino-4(3H)-pyrimidinone 5'-phosphate reductase n=1 Tax=Cytospora mali TaxID=578113 RepID=A0A194VX54_CYTMA|nr:2,5-diamino-6-ribosylamino-4(3H)-pyrimidinone 5'-phosphate reductase [Valsa mali]